MAKVNRGFMHLLLCLFWIASMSHVGGATAYNGTCPNTGSTNAEAWCKKTFQRQGTVRAKEKSVIDDKIECICNEVTSIVVYLNSNVSHDSANQAAQSSTTLRTEVPCTWSGVFEDIPGGNYCTTMTGVYPTGCNTTDPSFCYTYTCNTTMDGYTMKCNTCDGRVFIMKYGKNSSKTYSPPIHCDPAINCSSHGCCNTSPDQKTKGVCNCYRDLDQGYWDGETCSKCLHGYKTANGKSCTSVAPTIQVILASIATPLTMILPTLMVLALFTALGSFRRLWQADAPFPLTTLRRTGLSTIESTRRGERSLFRSKSIPKRPSKSQGFISCSGASKTSPEPSAC